MHLLPRDDLIHLTLRSNGAAFQHWGLRLAFHVVFVSLSLFLLEEGFIGWALLVLLPHCAAFSFLGWAGIGHELYHNSVFTHRGLNRFLFCICSILTWSNYSYFEASHVYHHRHTLQPGDAEGLPHPKIDGLALLWMLSFDLPGFMRRLRILGTNAVGVVPSGGGGALFPLGSKNRNSLVSAARVVLACQLALSLTFALFGAWCLILAVNLAPFVLTFFVRTLAIYQHYGLTYQAHGDYASSCRTAILPRFMAFFYANMNYHVEHHMYPSVPFYRLPELSLMLREKMNFPHIVFGYSQVLRTLATAGLFKS